MWKCCLPKNDDNAIEQSEKAGEKEDIIDRSNNKNRNSNLQQKFYVVFKDLIEGYENNEGECIDMSQPRDASYATETEGNFDSNRDEILVTERLGKDIHLTSAAKHQANIKNESFDPYDYRSMPTEERGITLRQLRAILPLIKRRCEKEIWTRPVYKDGAKTSKVEMVTLETATMYDINKYIIKPFTEFSQKSFVETLPSTKGTQPPRWFVSHYWGETFAHTMACIEQMVEDFRDNRTEEDDKRGGGMIEDTPLWICSFANNQHNLESDIADDPADTSFAKAMKIANFRVISILDKQGIDGVLAIYTYYEHSNTSSGNEVKRTAVGLVEGGTTIDGPGVSNDERQSYFPRERLLNFLSVSIQNAVASRNEDHIHILNSLVGRKGADLDLEPLLMHDNYDVLHDAIRGALFSSQATLNLIYDTGEERYWNSALSALEKSIAKEFLFDLSEMPQLPKEAAAQVFHHLPSGLEKLEIFFCCIGGEVGGKECGERLARFLARDDCKMERIRL